jgi:hypothetical protein
MGLDIVELFLAVEDTFQIHIANDETGSVATVGDLHSLVLSKIHWQDSKRCLTTAAFYRIRRALVDALGLERRQIRPSTPLAVILPEHNRRENWRRIQKAMRWKLPGVQDGKETLLSRLMKNSPALAFPNGAVTVGDLTRGMAALNRAGLMTEAGGWNKHDVWETLCGVIELQTCRTRRNPPRSSPHRSSGHRLAQ